MSSSNQPYINTNFSIGNVSVTLNDGRPISISPRQIGQLEYREGLLAKFLTVTISLGDTTSGLTDLIQGMEKFQLEFTDNLRKITYKFTDNSDNGPLYVYRIHNKQVIDNIKTVVIELCRSDAIVSMQKRVCKKYTNVDAETVVGDIITRELNTNNKKQKDGVYTTSNNIDDVMVSIPFKNDENIITNVNNLRSRDYFGPVKIDRLEISLKDSRGNLVNLNGQDWALSLVIEQLYQY